MIDLRGNGKLISTWHFWDFSVLWVGFNGWTICGFDSFSLAPDATKFKSWYSTSPVYNIIGSQGSFLEDSDVIVFIFPFILNNAVDWICDDAMVLLETRDYAYLVLTLLVNDFLVY